MIRKSNASTKFLYKLNKRIQNENYDQLNVNNILMKNFKSFNFKDNYKEKANLQNEKFF